MNTAKTTAEKIFFIINLIACTGVIITSMLQLFELWDKGLYVSVPLIGVVLTMQSIREWKKHRGVAIFSLCSAIFIFICTFVVIFSK